MKSSRWEKVRYWLEKNKWAIYATLITLPGFLYLIGVFYWLLLAITIGFVFFYTAFFIIPVVAVCAILFLIFFVVSRNKTPKIVEQEQQDFYRRLAGSQLSTKGFIHFEDGGPTKKRHRHSHNEEVSE